MGTPKLQHPAMPCVCTWHSHMCSECATPPLVQQGLSLSGTALLGGVLVGNSELSLAVPDALGSVIIWCCSRADIGLKVVREGAMEATWEVVLVKRKALPCFQDLQWLDAAAPQLAVSGWEWGAESQRVWDGFKVGVRCCILQGTVRGLCPLWV